MSRGWRHVLSPSRVPAETVKCLRSPPGEVHECLHEYIRGTCLCVTCDEGYEPSALEKFISEAEYSVRRRLELESALRCLKSERQDILTKRRDYVYESEDLTDSVDRLTIIGSYIEERVKKTSGKTSEVLRGELDLLSKDLVETRKTIRAFRQKITGYDGRLRVLDDTEKKILKELGTERLKRCVHT